MKTGFEQSIYALLLLSILPERAILPGEAISQQLKTSPTYTQKILRNLVRSELISSTSGVKGGFKLKKVPETISVYDVYLAVEGYESLYTSSGILYDMLGTDDQNSCCLLIDLMDEAESAWKSVLKKKTIASLVEDMHEKRFTKEVKELRGLVNEKRVL